MGQSITIIEATLVLIGSVLIYTLAKTIWQEITNK
jgi:hypothetical protein